MIKHELKDGPRCGTEFECKTGSITICQCQTVSLSGEQSDYISNHYDDCLCADCLDTLRSECNLDNFNARMSSILTLHH